MLSRHSIIMLIGGCGVAFIVFLYWTGILHYFNIHMLFVHHEYLQKYVTMHYVQAVMVYMVVYSSIVFCMMPITAVLNVAAGMLFGSIWGTIYSILSALIGALGSVLVLRYWLGNKIAQKWSSQVTSFKQHFNNNGAWYLLSLQLFPITPFPVIICCSAFSKVSLWTFTWTMLVGSAPATFLYVLAGTKIEEIQNSNYILSWNVIGLLGVLSLLTIVPMIMQYIKNVRYR